MASPRTESMHISLRTMFCCVVPVAAALWCAGAWPIWRWAGRGGLLAHTLACGVVLGVMFASAAVVKVFAGIGPGKAAFAFVAASLVRIVLCVGVTIALWAALGLPTGVLCVSVPAFYLATLLAEGFWLTRALNRDATLAALGRLGPPGRPSRTDRQGADRPDRHDDGAGR